MDKFRAATSLAALGILAGAAAIGQKAVEIASDTAESTSKVSTLLGKSSAAAMAFADTSATAYGISKAEALSAVGAMAAVDRAMGTGAAAASKLAVEYTKLSADLGSFNNASSAEVQEALTASLSGEYEMLKKYGIVVNDTTLANEAARIGMKKTGATWDSAQKRQLSYNIIMASTKAAQGDFARTSGGLANQTKIASARMEDLQGKIGAKLLPAVVKVAGAFNGLLDWVDQNQAKAKVLAMVVGGLAAVVVTAAVGLKLFAAAQMVVRAATMAWTGAMWLLNAAIFANPVTLIIVGLVALGAVFVALWMKSEKFRAIVTGAFNAVKSAAEFCWNWIKQAWPALLMILTGPIGLAVGLIVKFKDQIIGAFSAAWNAVKDGAAAAASWLIDKVQMVLDFYIGLPGRLGDLGSALVQKGKDFIQGFINGILDSAQAIPGVIKDKVVGAAQSALHGFGLFGSPSRLTMRYGRWWVEGFAIGIKDRGKAIDEAMDKMTTRISAAVERMKAKVDASREVASGIRDTFRSFADISSVETGSGFLAALQRKADQAEAFARGITALRGKGLDRGAIGQLTAVGPESGLAVVEQLLNAGGIGDVNAAMARIRAAGGGLGDREALARTGIDPNVRGRAMVGKVRVDLNLAAGADALTQAIVKELRKQIRVRGGNVQVVLGTGG